MNQHDPGSLYAQHLAQMIRRADAALARGGFDHLVVPSGTQHYQVFDDRDYPYAVNPQFKTWLPLTKLPYSWLIHTPGKRPTLVFYQPFDYWHVVPDAPSGWWVEHFDIHIIRQRKGFLKRSKLTSRQMLFDRAFYFRLLLFTANAQHAIGRAQFNIALGTARHFRRHNIARSIFRNIRGPQPMGRRTGFRHLIIFKKAAHLPFQSCQRVRDTNIANRNTHNRGTTVCCINGHPNILFFRAATPQVPLRFRGIVSPALRVRPLI